VVFGRKNCSVKISFPNGIYFKFKGLDIKFRHRDPKRHILSWNDVFSYMFFVKKNPFTRLGCSDWKEPKKSSKLVTLDGTENYVYGD